LGIKIKGDDNMKSNKLGALDLKTGRVYEDGVHVFDSIRKEEYTKKVRRIQKNLRENKFKELSLDDLELALKLHDRPKGVGSIKLDFGEDGYFTCRRDLNLVLELHDYTKAFLYSISHMITHDGRLKYGNNHLIPNVSKLKSYLGIANNKWNNFINPDIEKFNIMTKEKIDNKWCLLLNPIFATTTRTFTETMFIAFHSDLKKYLHPIEYLYLKKFYGIDMD